MEIPEGWGVISSLQKWESPGGWWGGGVLSESPPVVGVCIFSGTTHSLYIILHFCPGNPNCNRAASMYAMRLTARLMTLKKSEFGSLNIQLFRERLSEKMCTRQSRKVIWDMISTRFLTTVAVEPTFVAFLWHSQTHLHSLSYQFFQLSLRKKENSKPPTMPFRIVACTFADNLSRNSCILMATGCCVQVFIF